MGISVDNVGKDSEQGKIKKQGKTVKLVVTLDDIMVTWFGYFEKHE